MKQYYYVWESTNNRFNISHCSLTCAGVAVPSAVERKELQQFPIVKEVAVKLTVPYYVSLFNSVSISLQKVSSLQSQLLNRAQQLNQELEEDDQQLSKIFFFCI